MKCMHLAKIHTHLSLSICFSPMITKYRRGETLGWLRDNIVRGPIRDMQQRRERQVLPKGHPDKVTFKLGFEGCIGVHQEEPRRRGL